MQSLANHVSFLQSINNILMFIFRDVYSSIVGIWSVGCILALGNAIFEGSEQGCIDLPVIDSTHNLSVTLANLIEYHAI